LVAEKETAEMSRSPCSTRFGVFLFVAIFGFVARLPSQGDAEARRGGLELTSGLGRNLYSLPDDESVTAARKNLAADPKNVERILQLSKAQAGRRQYKEAVATSTDGLALAPKNADLYLERGHRELGLREFKAAMNDLEQATRLAPDMLDAFYHLGLAHYFLSEFDEAAASFDKARSLAKNNDSLIDCSNWLYVSLRRAGKEQDAAQVLTRITPEVKNTEPHLYFYLRLLRFYQGQLTAEVVLPPPPSGPGDLEAELAFDTVGYGVGNWRLYHHDTSEASGLFRNVVKGEAWNSWGFIGSEMELIRGGKQRHKARHA
jgi:tetratricopeptide (TPR) repeat protein